MQNSHAISPLDSSKENHYFSLRNHPTQPIAIHFYKESMSVLYSWPKVLLRALPSSSGAAKLKAIHSFNGIEQAAYYNTFEINLVEISFHQKMVPLCLRRQSSLIRHTAQAWGTYGAVTPIELVLSIFEREMPLYFTKQLTRYWERTTVNCFQPLEILWHDGHITMATHSKFILSTSSYRISEVFYSL